MGRIAKCESCDRENTKETEFYDYLYGNLGENEQAPKHPVLCWQCGIAVQLHQTFRTELELKVYKK